MAGIPCNDVDGMTLPVVTQEDLEHIRSKFNVRPDDTFVVGYVKSGTTWMQEITRLLRDGDDCGTDIYEAVPWIEGVNCDAPAMCLKVTDTEKMPSPRIFKSHLPSDKFLGGPPNTSPAKYIYVGRNPKDMIVSLFSMSQYVQKQQAPSWDDYFEWFINDIKVSGFYGGWFPNVLGWWRYKDEPNVLFLKYEDMKRDLPGVVKKIAVFLGYALEQEVLDDIAQKCTFENMKINPFVNRTNVPIFQSGGFLRKGRVGDWKNYFTPEQSAEFDALYAEKMKGTGLDFDFEA